VDEWCNDRYRDFNVGDRTVRQHHGIKVGDLVKFKHHIFDEYQPVHLVAEIVGNIEITSIRGEKVPYIRLSNSPPDQRHRADDFVIISRS
jgi:hypothetical protein